MAQIRQRYGVSEPISWDGPSTRDHRLTRELEECLHGNNLYDSKAGKQLRERVRYIAHVCSMLLSYSVRSFCAKSYLYGKHTALPAYASI